MRINVKPSWTENEYSILELLHPGQELIHLHISQGASVKLKRLAKPKRAKGVKKRPLTDEDWFQFMLYAASLDWELDQESMNPSKRPVYEPTPEDLVVRYVKHLFWKAGELRPVHFAVAFWHRVRRYPLTHLAELSDDFRDNIRRVKKDYVDLWIMDRFGPSDQSGTGRRFFIPMTKVRGQELTMPTRSPTMAEQAVLRQAITTFMPWGCRGQHLADRANILEKYFTKGSPWDNERIHALLCEDCCGLRRLIAEYNQPLQVHKLPDPGETWDVPKFTDRERGVPTSGAAATTHLESRHQMPNTLKDKRELQEHLVTRRRQTASYRAGVLRVLADGRKIGEFDPRKDASAQVRVPAAASYIEVYGLHDGEDLLLGVFPVFDFEPADGRLDLAVKSEGGQEVRLIIDPLPQRAEADEEGRDDYIAQVTYSEPGAWGRALRLAWSALVTLWGRGAAALRERWLGHGVGDRPAAAETLVTRRVLLASIGLNVALGAALMFELGRRRQSRVALHQEAKDAINQAFRDANRLMTLMDRASAREVAEAVQEVRVIPAVAYGETYPYPILGNRPPNTLALAEGLHQFADLRTDYEAALTTWGMVLRDLGDVLMQKSKVPEAILVFEYLRSRTSMVDLEILYALGELYKLTDRHDKAIALYQEMITRNLGQDDPRPWHFAGWSLYKLRRYEDALKSYQEALLSFKRCAAGHRGAYQGYAKVLVNIALLYRDVTGEDGPGSQFRKYLKESLDLTENAYLKERDDNPRITFSLAVIHGYYYECDTVLDYLGRALAKAPSYLVRAEHEDAFQHLRDHPEHPCHKRFVELLDRHRPPADGRFGPRLESKFDPTRFSE